MTIIIGAGLSGLLIAYRLKQEGLPFKILEARDRIGGRMNTVYVSEETPVDMGATWFGDQHQNLRSLLQELDMDHFEQYMEGTVFFQPFSTSPAQSIQIPSQPPSYRISGGSSNLIQTLYKALDEKDIFLNQTVKEIKFQENSVEVIAEDIFKGSQVVLAIPPKLWSKNISISPALPEDLLETAQQTQTWMEDSIKVALTYKKAFWQAQDLSGTLFSNTGPITEFYDHCNHERTKYALCGFMNSSFKQLTAEERKSKVMDQVVAVFGEKASDFMDYKECIWSEEKYTFEASELPLYPHQNNGNPIFRKSYLNNKLFISSSEAAGEFPGYMDGAVNSANSVSKKIIAQSK